MRSPRDFSDERCKSAEARACDEAASGGRLSASYTSNVEFYLFRDGSVPRFIANLARLPRHGGSVIVRSVFSGGATTVAGYNSASVTQPIQTLLDGYQQGPFLQYCDLIR